MVKTIISLYILVGLTLILSGCVNENLNNQNQVSENNKDYKLFSTYDFETNRLQCAGTGTSGEGLRNPNAFAFGLKLKVVDFNTGEDIEMGRGWYTLPNGQGGGTLGTESPYCNTHIDAESVDIEVYAKGYTPKKFKFGPLAKDKIVVIEVPLKKSCTEKIYDTKNEAYFFDEINSAFALNKEDYKLDCMEGELKRGGFIKTTGKYKDNSNFELFYHWGWCSSGGADCGDTLCFSTENEELLNNVNEYVAKKDGRFNTMSNINCLSN